MIGLRSRAASEEMKPGAVNIDEDGFNLIRNFN